MLIYTTMDPRETPTRIEWLDELDNDVMQDLIGYLPGGYNGLEPMRSATVSERWVVAPQKLNELVGMADALNGKMPRGDRYYMMGYNQVAG